MDRRSHVVSLIIVAVYSMCLYANTLNNDFVADDDITIISNQLIKDFGNISILLKKEYFTLSGEMTYRPIVTLSYLVDYKVFGFHPWGFHLMNMCYHALNVFLIYLLSLILYSDIDSNKVRWKALLPSILFAAHPVLTEAVNAISFREDLLVFLFYISALCLYIIIRKKPCLRGVTVIYLLSCISYLIALFSKEMAVTLPLAAYCYEFIYSNRERMVKKALPNRHIMGYLAITIFYGYIRFYHLSYPFDKAFPVWGIYERLLSLPWLLLNYIRLAIFPFSLSAYYDLIPVKSFYSGFFMFSIITFGTFLVLVILRSKVFRFGTIFFLITLLPVSNIIPIANPIAERYLYLPMAGIAIATGSTLNSIFKFRPIIVMAIFTVLTGLYTTLVIKRNMVWKSDYLLTLDNVKKMPDSAFARYYLGAAYYKNGQIREAVTQYKMALNMKPGLVEARNSLGSLYQEMGQPEEAIHEYRMALKVKPNSPKIHNNLGIVYHEMGRIDEAIKEYQVALTANPRPDLALYIHYNIGLSFQKKGLHYQAIDAFKSALKLKSGFLPARQALEKYGESFPAK